MCRAHVFPQHILPLLPLYNAQWWGYESLTAIVLVINLFSNDCVTLHDQMLCIICMAVNDDTFNANKLYVMLCYVMLCYVMLCYVMLCYVML